MKLIRCLYILIFISLSSAALAFDPMKEKILQSLENFARDQRIQATYELSANSQTLVSGAQGYADFVQNKRLSRSQMMPILSLTKR